MPTFVVFLVNNIIATKAITTIIGAIIIAAIAPPLSPVELLFLNL